jgi:hypothetical protein
MVRLAMAYVEPGVQQARSSSRRDETHVRDNHLWGSYESLSFSQEFNGALEYFVAPRSDTCERRTNDNIWL